MTRWWGIARQIPNPSPPTMWSSIMEEHSFFKFQVMGI
jgi:hypothetical protein